MASDDDAKRSFREIVEQSLRDGNGIPDFPSDTPLSNLAMAYHEAVGEFEKQGFPRGEALFLVSAMFCNNPGLGPAH